MVNKDTPVEITVVYDLDSSDTFEATVGTHEVDVLADTKSDVLQVGIRDSDGNDKTRVTYKHWDRVQVKVLDEKEG